MTEYCIGTSMEVLPMKLSNNINNVIAKQDKSVMRKICALFCRKSSLTVGRIGARSMG
jgi:hypothetical protein